MDQPIGRQPECASIVAFLDRVESGEGGVLLLEGSGGTGKTTLAEWGMQRASDRGFVALAGRSWEMSQSIPYEPIVAGLGRFLRTLAPDELRRLTAGLSSLASLLDGLEMGDAAERSVEVARARLHDAIATLLARIATDTPVLFLVDDLHWSDVSSLELLQFVCRDFPYVSVGIIATLRPGDADDRAEVRSFIAPLRRASFCSSVTVRNLDRQETTQLVVDRLGAEPPDRLVELVWSRSIGTPLLVHEMVEDLLERGVLTRSDRGWTLTDDNPPLPRAAADLIHDRVERASATERGVLEVLAVADEPISLDVLAATAGLPPTDTADHLRRLIANRLVREVVDPTGEVRWFADHPIIGHVVAAELDELVRQRLHRRLLAATPDAPVARRARHVLSGGPPNDPETAVTILVDAGETAFRQGATTQAVANFEAAEALLDSLDAARATEFRRRILLGRGEALIRLRHVVDAGGALEAAYGLATEADDPHEQLAVLAVLDSSLFLAGASSEPILDRLEGLEQRFASDEDWDALAEVHFRRFLTTGRDGHSSAIDHLTNALAQLADRPLGPRARLVYELLEASRSTTLPHPSDLDSQLDRLLARAAESGEWDLRRRAALIALDIASHLGNRELVERTLAVTRAVETEVGERPNWRIPVQRAILACNEGQGLGDLEVLLSVGQIDRGSVLVSFLRALEQRFSSGPDAALDAFEQSLASMQHRDRIALLYIVVGRMVLAEGTTSETEAAEKLLQGPIGHADVTLFSVPYFDYAEVLAATVAGSGSQLRGALSRLHEPLEVPDLPSAWRALARARQSHDDKERATNLLEAARLLDACGHRLEAANRLVEAAEADMDAVDSAALVEAGNFARSCGADWIAARAAALRPASPSAEPTHASDSLTKREWEVACHVARGLSNREVSQELFISIRTVTSHLDHIYTKLGFSSRDALSDYVAERIEENT